MRLQVVGTIPGLPEGESVDGWVLYERADILSWLCWAFCNKLAYTIDLNYIDKCL